MIEERAAAAIEIAKQAGALLKEGFGSLMQIDEKEGSQNLVTEYDYKAEKLILSHLSKLFPEDSFYAEESGKSGINSEEGAGVTWIIDPLDGTVNFAHKLPIFSVSIAAYYDGAIQFGVVYSPMQEELFTAQRGHGAFFNGKPITISAIKKLKRALLVTGFPYDVAKNPGRCMERVEKCLKLGLPLRRLGSAALDLCYVAMGRFEIYWEVSLQPWDLAAGALILEEAGGIFTQEDGKKRDLFSTQGVLATNGYLHKEMIEVLSV